MDKFKQIAGFIFVSIFTLIALTACTGGLKPPQGSEGIDAPLYPDAKTINVSQEDKSALIQDVFPGVNQNFQSNSDISWSKDSASKINRKLDELLEKTKWRGQGKWSRIGPFVVNELTYGDLVMAYLMIESLDSESLSNFERKYGITGIDEGATLIITYVYDTQHPLEEAARTGNLGVKEDTAQSESSPDQGHEISSGSTLVAEFERVSMESTATEQAKSQYMTAIAGSEIQALTATAEAGSRSATATSMSATVTSAQATAAVAATTIASQQAVTATAAAKVKAQLNAEARQLFPTLNSEFDTKELPETWVIHRPDPARWNLTKFPGSLQLFGASTTQAGYLNTFTQQTSLADMAIITKIEPRLKPGTESSGEKRFISIGFAPDDSKLAYGVGVGIYYHYINGYHAFLWACPKDYCAHPLDAMIDNYKLPKNDTTSYLKLERKGTSYSAYYSADNTSWTFIGGVKNFPADRATAQVVLQSGCTQCKDFHSRVDFVRYEVVEDTSAVSTTTETEIQRLKANHPDNWVALDTVSGTLYYDPQKWKQVGEFVAAMGNVFVFLDHNTISECKIGYLPGTEWMDATWSDDFLGGKRWDVLGYEELKYYKLADHSINGYELIVNGNDCLTDQRAVLATLDPVKR